MADGQIVSIVVPVMNEEDNIEPFYAAVRAVTDRLPEQEWEFLFVDDGSTDATLPRLLDLRGRDARVRILQLSRNFGSYAALRAGFDHARGDAVITISVDMQDPPALCADFVARWREGHHIVWGVRAQRDDPFGKRVLASWFYRLIRRLALPGLPTGGMDCGMFDRQVVDAFRRIPDKNSITFMTIYWMGFRQARVEYHRQRRQRGTSKWPVGKRVKSAIDVITSFSDVPIRFCSYLGLACSAVSLLGASIILFNRLVLGIGGWGWPSVMIAVLFLGGIQLVMLGVIGEYIWRIGNISRGQPWYIVMTRFGFEESPPALRDVAAS
jgi:glycosyltransferase involved in cell wall biosynthesis